MQGYGRLGNSFINSETAQAMITLGYYSEGLQYSDCEDCALTLTSIDPDSCYGRKVQERKGCDFCILSKI